jgi:hypothetical protein
MRNVSEAVSAPIFQVKIRVLLGSIEGANPNPWTAMPWLMSSVAGLSPRRPWFAPRVSPYGICEQSVIGTGFSSSYLVFQEPG